MRIHLLNIRKMSRLAVFVAVVATTMGSQAQALPRTFSLPSYEANPGGIIEVPLSLDNAAGLAAIEVNINFNPDVLELQAVSSGPLGDAFEMSTGNSGGVVQLVFTRAHALADGSGRLALLRFRANSGAEVDLFSELAIANLAISDETGVIDLRQKDELTTTNGQVLVSADSNIDNSGNGLPDWWEKQNNLDLFAPASGTDDDNDSMDTFFEYAFGGNPKVPDAALISPFGNIQESGGSRYLTITFRRRVTPAPMTYWMQEGSDLENWDSIAPNLRLLVPPVDLGDGLQRVTVRSSQPIGEIGSPTNCFLRIRATPTPAQ
jgi:hypothetical protein